ncbi:MAG: glucosaminidase domain-containing protein [Dysgonamonadaceae bacterium]|jgi:hypothetical protein|nr:glucosaminidase domain-containing protein [Dysgonamonadaceae bacterium]
MKLYRYLFLGICCLMCGVAPAQKQSTVYLQYINQFSDLAVDHMQRYRIPASITLAQGILESGAGQSKFVKESNNHFGIKCQSDWQGDRIFRADDSPDDCFRVYKNAHESFEDHSRFLSGKKRYTVLFELEMTDYEGWAKGLSACGYATDPAYAQKLIRLIEDYELFRYDLRVGKGFSKQPALARTVYKTFDLLYVVAGAGDSVEKIAADLGFKAKDLLKYNEIPAGFPLVQGDIIYLEKKKKQADEPHYTHIVRSGDSMYSISQRYGIQLSRLYKLNKKKEDYVPQVDNILFLRKI